MWRKWVSRSELLHAEDVPSSCGKTMLEKLQFNWLAAGNGLVLARDPANDLELGISLEIYDDSHPRLYYSDLKRRFPYDFPIDQRIVEPASGLLHKILLSRKALIISGKDISQKRRYLEDYLNEINLSSGEFFEGLRQGIYLGYGGRRPYAGAPSLVELVPDFGVELVEDFVPRPSNSA
jgi:hypothetical protein